MRVAESAKPFSFTVLFDVGAHAIRKVADEGEFLSPQLLDALYENGCQDATFGRRGQLFFAEFDRKASSLPDAVLTAIENLESASPDVVAIRVEPEELVNAASIASRTGRSRESIRLLVGGQRGPGDFPQPRFYLDEAHPIWTWSSVAGWYAQYTGNGSKDAVDAAFLASLNAALEIRRYLPKSLRPQQRLAIKRLLDRALR